MNMVFHKRFEKMAEKISSQVKHRMVEWATLFTQDPLNNQLRNHALHTPYKGSYSIDITGDYRAIYVMMDKETALFTHIGTHSKLYR